MSSQSLAGRKRRFSSDFEPQTPVRRRKVSDAVETVQRVFEQHGVNHVPKCVLSSPTDVTDTKVMQQTRQIRTKQVKRSKLPIEQDTKDTKEEEASELETEVEAEVRTPRPSVPRPTARPPLSERVGGLNRARFGVGIVRCRNWKLSGEDTETEDESPASSPRPSYNSKPLAVSIESSGCGCAEENSEDQIGTSVLPIDPNLQCFDRNCDQWQLRSPPPDDLPEEHNE
ncbi:hypothetical protein PHMEG_00015705 [Phytophthora megakarya]|uniref:Uncharacterized protein n=1 Tax=Phytophthora megakarya TaxID=4795 RepID=A0A225W2R1_9STRA|nr:hypothetical protein PHMEG_00015705 [Phytophthora megakarya]